MVAALSVPVTWASFLPNKQNSALRYTAFPTCTINACSREATSVEESCLKRRPILLGVGALVANLLPASSVFAKEGLENYQAFVDSEDGYSYYYPSDWRDFDFRGHDSAFKDRYLPLQNVRLSFIPTDKTDIHELGPMEEVIFNLVRHKFSAPTQRPTIFDMQERTIDGRNYYTFEYDLTSPNFSRTAFATIAIGNGRYYTLIVGANERRWRRVRNQLKVVADSFKVLDI
ncbi:Photosystem II PsbP [Macleaya cordata]|uniref:Photosystem II PsbP n=1 Tax=Macleaya cordata TaxID=56857 RepID=A0A200R698_MACCD|nr:Photosystem II PsbP [Macleaya cordata]